MGSLAMRASMATAFGLAQVAQLVEPADQGGERLGVRGWRRPGRLIGDEGGETGEHSSIDRIGLGEPRRGLSESAGAIGMHATKGQAELGRDPHQGALIAAGRFADHGAAALRPGSAQGFGNGGDRVGDPHGAARIIGDVEPILRNIDANA
jgi:hypothetical protein